MRTLTLILPLTLLPALSGCVVGAAVDLAATTVVTAGKLAIKGTGALIGTAIPDGDDKDKKDKKKDKKRVKSSRSSQSVNILPPIRSLILYNPKPPCVTSPSMPMATHTKPPRRIRCSDKWFFQVKRPSEKLDFRRPFRFGFCLEVIRRLGFCNDKSSRSK